MVQIRLKVHVRNFRHLQVGDCIYLNDNPRCNCESNEVSHIFIDNGKLPSGYYFRLSCDEHCKYNCDINVDFIKEDGNKAKYIKDVVYLRLSQTIKEKKQDSEDSEDSENTKENTYENYIELLLNQYDDFVAYPLDENGYIVSNNESFTLGEATSSKYELYMGWQFYGGHCEMPCRRGMKRKDISNREK